MDAIRICSTATTAGLLAGAFLAAAIATVPPAIAGDAHVKANYYISIAGFTIGRADIDGDFSDTSYTAEISGSTRGLIRLVSDSQATLTGNGRIDGARVMPIAYSLASSESGLETRVDMAMSGGSILKVEADPPLQDTPDRVPLRPGHKRRVVDPLAAFIVALGDPAMADGEQVCNRTVPVFDGWQRFDVSLFYKETKKIKGRGDSYSGDVIVCGARYVPIAGHRLSRESIQYMAQNKRLEIWLVPVENTDLFLPYRVVIGTQIGDIVIGAKTFVVAPAEQHASAN